MVRPTRAHIIYEREAADCRAAAEVNRARGAGYEAWAAWYEARADRYEVWRRGRPGSEVLQTDALRLRHHRPH